MYRYSRADVIVISADVTIYSALNASTTGKEAAFATAACPSRELFFFLSFFLSCVFDKMIII